MSDEFRFVFALVGLAVTLVASRKPGSSPHAYRGLAWIFLALVLFSGSDLFFPGGWVRYLAMSGGLGAALLSLRHTRAVWVASARYKALAFRGSDRALGPAERLLDQVDTEDAAEARKRFRRRFAFYACVLFLPMMVAALVKYGPSVTTLVVGPLTLAVGVGIGWLALRQGLPLSPLASGSERIVGRASDEDVDALARPRD